MVRQLARTQSISGRSGSVTLSRSRGRVRARAGYEFVSCRHHPRSKASCWTNSHSTRKNEGGSNLVSFNSIRLKCRNWVSFWGLRKSCSPGSTHHPGLVRSLCKLEVCLLCVSLTISTVTARTEGLLSAQITLLPPGGHHMCRVKVQYKGGLLNSCQGIITQDKL